LAEAPRGTAKEPGRWVRLARWVDDRFGLSYPLLRPVPRYALNPLYWLGALTVVAFVILGVSGVLLMLYYIPTPALAYSSTDYIFKSVYYGRFLQTVHLYTAYAMVVLAFAHMMRGFFVSVHKRPREMMWALGMLMGMVTLAMAFTGYLLPWTVISKSATDVVIGMLAALPAPVGRFLSFLIVGNGSDADELLRFYDLHVVVLPAILLVLLAVKMYMLEVHGISEPASGRALAEKQKKATPIFPDVTLYLMEIAAVFGTGMLLISALFPLDLPPRYTPSLAGQYTAQPDWYFLWLYQILKISAFEGPGLPVVLSLVVAGLVALFLLPFIDRGPERAIRSRPVFVTLGCVLVAELVVLTVWGLLTPGQVISTAVAAGVLGGTALAVIGVSYLAYRVLGPKMRREPS
jgi:quinol-cytochrome oxidoreductase complex cytochrome b subunit